MISICMNNLHFLGCQIWLNPSKRVFLVIVRLTKSKANIIVPGRELTIILVSRLNLIGIKSAVRNLGWLIVIIHLFHKDSTIIPLFLNLIGHTFLIHDPPKIILGVHTYGIVPTCYIFVDSIVVLASQVHRLSYIQIARNDISLATTMPCCIASELLSQRSVWTKEKSLSLHLVFKSHDKTNTLFLLEGVEVCTSAMINHHWLTILIHHLRGVFWVIFPITKPLFEVGSTHSSPLFGIQLTLLSVRSKHIRAFLLGFRHDSCLFFFK